MRLKIRNKDKNLFIETLNEQSLFKDLTETISNLTGIPPLHQELKIGYPPRVYKAKDEDTLASAGLQNGDSIILTELSLAEVANIQVAPTVSTSVSPANNPTPSASSKDVMLSTSVSPVNKPTPSASSKDVIAVPVENDFIILREMPDDNSCLFRAIGHVLLRSDDSNGDKVQKLRQTIVSHIRGDPINYSDVILGKKRETYCSLIAQKDSWGGAIELSIFATLYKTEIRSVDVRSGRVDRYGQGKYKQCVFIIYSGIHYDAIALTPSPGASQEYDQTVFDVADDVILRAAMGVADKMKKLHRYTYTSDFTLKCDTCMQGIKGETEAVAHAKVTGHQNFIEY